MRLKMLCSRKLRRNGNDLYFCFLIPEPRFIGSGHRIHRILTYRYEVIKVFPFVRVTDIYIVKIDTISKIIFTNVHIHHSRDARSMNMFPFHKHDKRTILQEFKNTISRYNSKSRATFEHWLYIRDPSRETRILIAYTLEPGVYEIEREWRKLFPSDVFASFSMFRIENSGERIEAFRLEGRRNTCVVFPFRAKGRSKQAI